MQNNSNKRDGARGDAEKRAADSALNQRLVEHLKANAIKPGRLQPANDRQPKRGFFAEAYALLSLAGLMIVAYLYTLLVGEKA